jgi:hypothetical protein
MSRMGFSEATPLDRVDLQTGLGSQIFNADQPALVAISTHWSQSSLRYVASSWYHGLSDKPTWGSLISMVAAPTCARKSYSRLTKYFVTLK